MAEFFSGQPSYIRGYIHAGIICVCLIPYISSILFWKLPESLMKALVNLLFSMCPQPHICSLIVRAQGKFEAAEIEMEKGVFGTFGVSSIGTEYLCLENMLYSLRDEFFQALLPILGIIESFSSLER